ncbi:MAG TPA: hypothetical protein VFZ52_10050 [Chryseolinea sp.]
MNTLKAERLPFVLFAAICLLCGLWTGLSRIGWHLHTLPGTAHHGAIMVGGFLGTLISLEKIIPLKRKMLFVIPLLSASSILFYTHPPTSIIFLMLSSAGLVFVFAYYFGNQRSLEHGLMVIGALCWLIGNIMLFTKSFYPVAFSWWLAFTLFVVTGERLELMKFLPITSASKMLLSAFLGLFLAGTLLSFHGIGKHIGAVALICISSWLLRNDLVGIAVRKNGLTRFIAISLSAGYIALLVVGILFIAFSNNGLSYDAIVHSYFIGFVFSMIFAHGPVILPGVLGLAVKPFHKILYAWLFLLHSSWLIRTFSDAYGQLQWRMFSGILSAAAILGFMGTVAILTIKSRPNVEVR